MTKENIVSIDGDQIKESDLTPEQHHHKNHVISLRNKLVKLQFEMDDLMPSLKFADNRLGQYRVKYQEQALIEATQKQAEEELGKEEANG